MKSHDQNFCTILSVAAVLCLAMAAIAANLTGSDLSVWCDPTGQWQVVGGALPKQLGW